MTEKNLECRLAVGAVLRFWITGHMPYFMAQVRDEGVAEAGKVGLGAGFVDTHKGETLFEGLVSELGSESDGILTPKIIMKGLDYEPVYADTVVGWAFKDGRTEGKIATMNKNHSFFIVDIPWAVAKELEKAGNQNAEVRNWFMYEALRSSVMALDWAEWSNILTPNEPGDFHQRTATLTALERTEATEEGDLRRRKAFIEEGY